MFEKIFRDADGQVTLWQAPNPALYGWLLLTVINHFVQSPNLAWLATALLFAWAFMELYQGVNLFRRILGLVILVLIIMAHWK